MARCGLCKRWGRVPWEAGERAPGWWSPPPGSPAAAGQFPTGAAPTTAAVPLTCRHLGAETTGERVCPTCRGNVRLKEFTCALGMGAGHGGRAAPAQDCGPGRCPGYNAEPTAAAPARPAHPTPPPVKLAATFERHTLAPHVDGIRFNPSLIRQANGDYLLAYRTGWRGSQIHAAALRPDLSWTGHDCRVTLFHRDANFGREDPRWFMFRGQRHLYYTGVVGGYRGRHTNTLYARLTDDCRVEAIYSLQIPGRRPWEKNVIPFEYDGRMYAVYQIAPHRVLVIDGDRCEFVTEERWSVPWSGGGELRGGASPILVGDEYWSFCHDSVDPPGRKKCYRTWLYTFEARPPFRPRRVIPYPVQEADPQSNHDNYADVLYVGSATPVDGNWLLACGVHDRYSEIYSVPHAELEARLVPV